MNQHWDGILDALESHLRYRLETGETEVELDPAVLEGLRQAPAGNPKDVVPPPPAEAAAVPQRATPESEAAPSAAAGPSSGVTLEEIAAEIAVCTRCRLCEARTRTVPGQGPAQPALMFVGEGPGEEEDAQGLAFVGRAGELLTRMIDRMGLTREDVFIGNIVKCRPPGNRNPCEDEIEACLPYLKAQIARLQPRVIVALGGIAAKTLLQTSTGITRLRGQWASFEGIDLMPTFHPSYLLRDANKEKRWDTWRDMQAVLERLGLPVPDQSGK